LRKNARKNRGDKCLVFLQGSGETSAIDRPEKLVNAGNRPKNGLADAWLTA
jgi:hypothetical protein